MRTLSVSRNDLDAAVRDGLLAPDQADALWMRWANGVGEARPSDPSRVRFDGVHLAYFSGALLVISAMGWFMTEAWLMMGGWALSVLALFYAAVFTAAGWRLYFVQRKSVPGGLLFTVAVCMTPLFVFGVEQAIGVWPQGDPGSFHDYYVYVRGSWVAMELATVAVGAVTLIWIRFPFLTAPISVALWFLSMDLTPLLFGRDDFSWSERRLVSFWFGLGLLTVAYVIDRRTREDYAFWLYLFGTVAFWGGLSTGSSSNEWQWLGYFLVNGVLMVASVLLQRRVLLIFGSMGAFGYVGHLAWDAFEDSLLFPFVLTVLGVALLLGGIMLQKHQRELERRFVHHAPSWLRRLLPAHRAPPSS